MTAAVLPGYDTWPRPLFGRGGGHLLVAVSACVRAEEVGEAALDKAVAAEELFESEAARAVSSDPDRFLVLYERHYDRILNYLYRRTFDLDLAQDLTSRTFLLAFEHLRSAERRVRVRPWLYRIATNAHLSHGRGWTSWLKRFEAVGREFLRGAVSRPDAGLVRRSEEERLRQYLAGLPERDRTPLLLRYYEELPYREIARVLGGSETGARTRVLRALRRLESRMLDPEERR